MTFVDIAGIIKGASAGAGLGNKFLQNIKDVDVVLHVVRCFDDPQVIHVDSTIDPLADMETIETELLLADLQTVEKRIENAEKKNKTKDAAGATMTAAERSAFLLKLRGALNAGYALSDVSWDNETEVRELASMHLLTAKPMAYVCNVDESSVQKGNKYTEKVQQHVDALNAEPERTLPPEAGGVRIKRVPRACLRVCSQLESEVQTFDSAEARAEFLAMNSLEGTSLVPVIHTANRLLQNEKYYTVGVQEARAWSIERGTNAQDAAGKIHSDLRDKFVCAEVIKPADFIKHGGDAGARQAGVMRVEGKSYIVQDADIILFRVQGQKR
jgi:GTP-binding protein YchF